MATIGLIIIILWWNPQKLFNYYCDETKKEIAEIEKNKKVKNVD
jgi:hypothetical protein